MTNYQKAKIFFMGIITTLLLIFVFKSEPLHADEQNQTDVGRYSLIADPINRNQLWIIDTKSGDYRMLSRGGRGYVCWLGTFSIPEQLVEVED